MVESTIDKIKDITVERQIRKLAGIIDEQNDTISQYGDASAEIETLKTSDAKQTADIANLNNTVAPIPAQIQSLIDTDANQATQINNLKSDVAKNTTATENLNNRVTIVEQDITNTESEITSVKAAITDIQSKDIAQDGTLATHSEQIQGITESLISDVQILDGTTTGEIKVRIDRESVAAIDSNSYNLGLPVSAEIIQGTGPSMFKVQITMSSGVKVVSNDFVFTTEAIGNDVYISSFTFKAGSQNGYLSADIGLNNGVTIEANNFLVPTDPNVIANITDLQTRMTNVENSPISDSRITAIETKNTEQDNKINALETKNTEQDTAIQKNTTDINSLNSEVSGVMSDLDTKADLNNSSQTIVAGTVKATNITNAAGKHVAIAENVTTSLQTKVDKIQGTQYEGKVLGINDSGVVTPVDMPSGGEVWEAVDLTESGFPTDWKKGDRIKVSFKYFKAKNKLAPASWTSSFESTGLYIDAVNGEGTDILEFEINDTSAYNYTHNSLISISTYVDTNNNPNAISLIYCKTGSYTEFNNRNRRDPIFVIYIISFNGSSCKYASTTVYNNALPSYINKMWRLKK